MGEEWGRMCRSIRTGRGDEVMRLGRERGLWKSYGSEAEAVVRAWPLHLAYYPGVTRPSTAVRDETPWCKYGVEHNNESLSIATN